LRDWLAERGVTAYQCYATADIGLIAYETAAREGLVSGRLKELHITPGVKATARFAYVTLAGRTAAPVMRLFRRFVRDHLRD
jgi:hypothetical protein